MVTASLARKKLSPFVMPLAANQIGNVSSQSPATFVVFSTLRAGHFLYYAVETSKTGSSGEKTPKPANLSSPWFGNEVLQSCSLWFAMHASAMTDGTLYVLLTNPNHTWEVKKIQGNTLHR